MSLLRYGFFEMILCVWWLVRATHVLCCSLNDVLTASPAAPQEPMTGLTTVAYSPSNSGVYLGSPSIVGPLTNGTLLISHDTFFGGNTTHIVASENGGRSWKQRSTVSHQYWSSLFQIKGLRLSMDRHALLCMDAN